MPDDNRLTAYQIHPHANMDLTPATVDRDWMDAADQRHPYRCLPLNIANQNGWFLSCPTDFRVFWYGGSAAKDLDVEFIGHKDPSVTSHFGSGVLTFSIPYLFRTPEGINLWVKGPANMPKDGVVALEGIVETDWATSTFTMNWKVTRPNEWITFRRGEPVCLIVPIPRGLTESLDPGVEPACAAGRCDGPRDVGQDRQVGQGARLSIFAPRPRCVGGRRGAAQDQAGLLECLAHRRQGQGARAAGGNLGLQPAGDVGGQIARCGGGEIRPVDPPAGKHPLRRHEDMPWRPSSHQHLGPRPAPRQDQGRRVLGPLGAADARGVGQVLCGVEGGHLRLPFLTPFSPPAGLEPLRGLGPPGRPFPRIGGPSPPRPRMP